MNKKISKEKAKITLDYLIRQTNPKPLKARQPRLLTLEQLDRLSKLEDLNRLADKIRRIEDSPAAPKEVGALRLVREESFEWLVDLARDKYETMKQAIEAEYPSKR